HHGPALVGGGGLSARLPDRPARALLPLGAPLGSRGGPHPGLLARSRAARDRPRLARDRSSRNRADDDAQRLRLHADRPGPAAAGARGVPHPRLPPLLPLPDGPPAPVAPEHGRLPAPADRREGGRRLPPAAR